MHQPYEERLKHKADFRVKYKFRSQDEGGRKTGEPNPGIRSDFSFVEDAEHKMHMIWPEFEDSEGIFCFTMTEECQIQELQECGL